MAIIKECEKCHREKGYAKEANAKICARCVRKEELEETNTPNPE